MAREPRFPGIDWHCDHCGASLNSQKNFDDHKYIWKCTSCGYKNSISRDNIRQDDSIIIKSLLHFLGFLSYVNLWTTAMLGVSLFIFHSNFDKYFAPFLMCLVAYVIVFIITLVVEFGLRHTKFSKKNMFGVVFRNLKEDILEPFMAIKELVSNFISFITHKLPIKRKYIWYSNKAIIAYAVMYTLIIIAEAIALIIIKNTP